MDRNEEIEKISEELEGLLRMTSEKRSDREKEENKDRNGGGGQITNGRQIAGDGVQSKHMNRAGQMDQTGDVVRSGQADETEEGGFSDAAGGLDQDGYSDNAGQPVQTEDLQGTGYMDQTSLPQKTGHTDQTAHPAGIGHMDQNSHPAGTGHMDQTAHPAGTGQVGQPPHEDEDIRGPYMILDLEHGRYLGIGDGEGHEMLEDYTDEELLDDDLWEESLRRQELESEELDAKGQGRRPEKRPAKRPARDHSNLIKPSDGLAAAFFVPVIIMIIIFAQKGIFPFGEESFLRTDMYHQYAPFFSEFQYKLTHGGSLLYSWDVGMGVNFAALYAYYLASPLNWLIVLCPKDYVIEFMTYMIVFKIGLSGLSFAWYLRKHCKTRDFGIAFFGIFYALSGYMAAYSWNIMWLDCILLFPLIMLGLERLVHEKKWLLYCITLGLSILSNYYISIMICIFMVLYFGTLLLLEQGKKAKDYGVAAAQFAFASLAAGGLAAAVLLPEVFALQTTASGDFNFPKTFTSYFSIFDMIARHLPDVETEIGLDHWPNIYCGVAVLMLFLLYLGCRKIRMKEKVVYCGLLLFFFASFSVNVLNFIWHGFHYPNSLPARQSFLYIFLILLMCYQAYTHLKEIPWKHVVLAFFASVIFVLLAQKLITDQAYHFSVFYVAIVYLAAYAGLMYLYQKGTSRNVLVLLGLGLVCVEAAVNTTITSVTTTSRTSYVRDNEASIYLTQSLLPNESFYRVEKVNRKSKNDGAWLNFPSVSLFSSTANADLSKFFKKLGCESSTNAYSITGSTPLVDSLFAVKYGLYSEEAKDTGLLKLVDSMDDMYLYENANTLPVGFMVPYDLQDNWQLELGNPADVQNDLAAVAGADPVLLEVPGEITGTSFHFTPESSGDYYVYVSNKKVKKVSAMMGERSKSFDNVDRGYLLELGYIEAGVEVTLRNDDNEQDLVAMAYRFLPEGLASVYNALNRSPLTLTEWNETRVAGSVDTGRAGLLFLSIPYDEGWTIRVDGDIVEPYKIFDTFLSVDVSEGYHEISLEYMPKGLKEGIWITAGSVLCIMIALAFSFHKKVGSRTLQRRSRLGSIRQDER